MRSIALPSASLFLGIIASFGCSLENESASSESNATSPGDLALAKKAAALISGANAHCNQCHTAGREDVKRWGDAMRAVAEKCLPSSTALTPAQSVACMSEDARDPTAPFTASKLGLFAAGGAVLEKTFRAADPTGARFAAFSGQAAMPAGAPGTPLTESEFKTIQDWVLAGMPAFNEVFGGPPEPEPCVTSIGPGLSEHLRRMKTDGWGARLADASTTMFGCAGEGDPATCLAAFPDASSKFGNPAVSGQKLRVLRDMPKTNYWVRSSADGRFVGFGQNTAAGIFDLLAPAGSPPIAVDARYDPVFFPNNDGISFAGTDLAARRAGPIRVCRQSVLDELARRPDAKLTLRESGCAEIANAVYQSIGAALDGSVYFMSIGSHVNDDGGNIVRAPLPGFELDAKTFLLPMVSDGVSFQPRDTVELATPLEGDPILSPSSQLLVTRLGSQPTTSGYRIRRITTTSAGGRIGAATEIVGTICGAGAKASFSYDERFVVTHRYVDPAAQGGLPTASSNVTMTDLLTGEVTRLTTMGPNQYALYPHFRADGWLYFLVRDLNPGGKDRLVASDAALRTSAR